MTVGVFEGDDHFRPSSLPQGGDLSKSLQIYLKKVNNLSSEPSKLSDGNFSLLIFLKINHINNGSVRRFSFKKLGSRDISNLSKSLQIHGFGDRLGV